MFIRLRILSFCIFLLFALGSATSGFAQACNGADGTGIFNGSIANRDNGTVCANNAIQPALMEIDINNIDESGTIEFEINWDDGSAPERGWCQIGPPFFASQTFLFAERRAG
jgi:hypothetical protein